MMQCWRCRTTVGELTIHHVNGNPKDEKPQNLLKLCKKCHDFVQGICDNCVGQPDCYVQKLQRCYRFEDALPPIYFRDRKKSEWLDSHLERRIHQNPNNIAELVKFGHNLKSSMISETYKFSEEFQRNFVKCDVCGDFVKWRLSPGKSRVVCSLCVQEMCGGNLRAKG